MKRILIALLLPVLSFAQEVTVDSTAQKLDELVLTSAQKTISVKNGNIKVDVANSIYKSVPNVLDLLAKLPKIQISADRESISIVGKGQPLIYIDNAKADMETLQSLSVDDIKSVEIVTNPSAKYEADGKAVILITRKKSRREGFQTVFSETASFKKDSNFYNSIAASWKTSKTEFRGNVSYNHLNPWESNANDYEIPDAAISSGYRVDGFSKRRQFLYGGSIFRQLNDNDYVSLAVNGKSETDAFRFHTLTENIENEIVNNIETVGNNDARKNSINAVLNYSNRSKSGESGIFIGAQYSKLGTPSNIFSFNNYNEMQFAPFVATHQDFDIGVFSARADYDMKIAGYKIEAGVQHSSASSQTHLDNTDFEQNTTTRSVYDLDEKINSGYVQLSGEFRKVTWLVGMRVENTDVDGRNSSDSNVNVSKNYTDFFPKIQIDIPIDSTKTINLNYSKSISRPNFSAINQGVTYINPYFVFTGNVNLNPSVSDELSANFQYKDKSLKVGYYKTKNNINYSFLYNQDENLLTHRPENFDREMGYTIELTAPFSYDSWTTTNVCSFNVSEIEDNNAIKFTVKPYIYFYSNHQLALKNQWTISLTGWGMSKRYQGILENNAFFIVDTALSKSYKNWTFSFSANDLFRNMNFEEKFSMTGVSTVGKYYVDAREFAFSVKYKFGKVKSEFEEKTVDENSGRIK